MKKVCSHIQKKNPPAEAHSLKTNMMSQAMPVQEVDSKS